MNLKSILLAISFATAGATGYALYSQLQHHDNSTDNQNDVHGEHSGQSEHNDDVHRQDNETEMVEKKGKHGGKLLSDGKFSIEVTIHEAGVPPEMRVYAYENGQPIDLTQVELFITLDRLGGKQEVLNFKPEKDYLLGSQVIAEPHSYDVKVSAQYAGKLYEWEYESHEGRAYISDRLFAESGMQTEVVGSQTIKQKRELFGIIVVPQDQKTRVFSPYPSKVKKVHVKIGDEVQKGQILATLQNIKTLQTYTIKSSTNGLISNLWSNTGEIVQNDPLMQVSNLDKVWVELSAFPKDIARLNVGQNVVVKSLDEAHQVSSTLDYLSPTMTDGHIARARTVIDNSSGYWKPGMHIKAQVTVGEKKAPLAINQKGLQSFRSMPVVFAKYGNDYEVRMLELGEEDEHYIEVLGGIEPGTEYATENSFLVKADALKSGASHDH
ncbi:efflux RND transporter periplasmic adaptor subunit [Thiomicrorhabdus sediminis]|uniref:HlyD family efflux transporter periplasmic adaptor subunit n=1 Tax=Thiomicrorhabdus sediminis TaxID=2580412 RepID=A0A4P9K9H7_9GAMM|nr:efflux RND transporter periplasmic adaptor subunit [Thiomicrorhabdus sediminis]QCU90987.1 HlyD family efflux transporter periplasmic adaptor subunit [Thiomicrorhabdus sediminis]